MSARDVYDRNLMEEVISTARRPWSLEQIAELWITLMPGTYEIAVSLKPEDRKPANFKFSGQAALAILKLVNAWPKS